MREIIFRGRDVHTKEWRYGSLIDFVGDGTYFLIVEPYPSASTLPLYVLMKDHAHFVVPETVCQYTGLKDKNGQRIFDGDVVYWPYEDENGEIHWAEGEARFGANFPGVYADFDHFYGHELEVVGNAYDNPELLSANGR